MCGSLENQPAAPQRTWPPRGTSSVPAHASGAAHGQSTGWGVPSAPKAVGSKHRDTLASAPLQASREAGGHRRRSARLEHGNQVTRCRALLVGEAARCAMRLEQPNTTPPIGSARTRCRRCRAPPRMPPPPPPPAGRGPRWRGGPVAGDRPGPAAGPCPGRPLRFRQRYSARRGPTARAAPPAGSSGRLQARRRGGRGVGGFGQADRSRGLRGSRHQGCTRGAGRAAPAGAAQPG